MLLARSGGRGFLLRVEDLDHVAASEHHEARQLDDLARIGVRGDDEPVRQSDRLHRHLEVVAELRDRDLLYPCYCTRREIREEIEAAASAPNGPAPPDAYPGTCRHLTRDERSRLERDGRRPAWRLRADDEQISFVDGIAGERTGRVDDFVVVRADGVPAYQLAVVIDDADAGIDQVARGDDLIPSTWRQIRLHQLLGLDSPEYWHLPLVVAADGRRLAKRDGAISLRDIVSAEVTVEQVVAALLTSLGMDADAIVGGDPSAPGWASAQAQRFDPSSLGSEPVVIDDLRASWG
jgi:glutamyl-tRNA synthetase